MRTEANKICLRRAIGHGDAEIVPVVKKQADSANQIGRSNVFRSYSEYRCALLSAERILGVRRSNAFNNIWLRVNAELDARFRFSYPLNLEPEPGVRSGPVQVWTDF